MKKIISTIALASTLFGATTIELACDKGYEPYSYKDAKLAKGIYVDVITSAFSKMPDYNVKFTPVAWKRAITFVKKGTTVGFFPPYYNKTRTSWTKFSEPILEETATIFALSKVIDTKKNFPEDYKGLTLCMNRGFVVSTFGNKKFQEMIEKEEIILKWGNDNKVCLHKIAKGKADFYINDTLIDIKEFPTIKKGLTTKKNYGYIGFTLKDKNYPFMKDLQIKLNQTIKEMKANGEIDKILEAYK